MRSIFFNISTYLAISIPALYAQEDIQVENLGENVNSKYLEANPIISPDGKTLYFFRENHPDNTYGKKDSQDIWFSVYNKESGQWSKAERMPAPLNQAVYNGVFSVTPDGTALVIRGAYEEGHLVGHGCSVSNKTNQGWEVPHKFEIDKYEYYDKGNYSGAFLNNDGNVLIIYLSEEEEGELTDLYVSFYRKDGMWSQPQALGSEINTEYDEFAPYLAADNKTLYFASDKPGGLGGSDIYMTRRLDDTWRNWSKPVNIGAPVNTEDYEQYYSVCASGEYAYLVISKNSYGLGDIARIKLKEDQKPDPVVLIEGTVYDDKTRQTIGATVIYENLKTGKLVGVAHADPITGKYKITLPCGEAYGFSASASGYYPVAANTDLTNVKEYQEASKELHLVPIEKGRTIRLNNIFFESNSDVLQHTSDSELERLVSAMKTNIRIKIEISGHTDNLGSHQSNMDLSQKRAEAVTEYLTSHGIGTERIKSIGYGEMRPVSTNETAEGRKLNRRVEFTVLED